MFRALVCPSSARDNDVDYHIGGLVSWFVVGWKLGVGRLE